MRTTLTTLIVLTALTAAAAADWPQWGGSPARNNAPDATGIADDWNVGAFDFDTGAWIKDDAKGVRWVTKLGSQSYGNPVVAGGKVYVGTNNESGYVKRFSKKVDLGVLLCLRESDGSVLWQHSNEKLKSGSAHDWPHVGVCASPLVEGDRLWYVNNRCEVVCLDTEGFHDGENDGVKTEANENKDEADVVWVYDMIGELGVSPHNMSNCSVTGAGDLLFVCTSNGTDEDDKVVKPDAASFIAVNKKTGKLVWESSPRDVPGGNILHGQWSSPAYSVIDDIPQVIFGAGDGWLYAFHATDHDKGVAKLLWKCDLNPKASQWDAGGSGNRNNIIATPVIAGGLVYIATGQDPEHGEGTGTLWCIDPAKAANLGGDVSETLVYSSAASDAKIVPPRRELNLDTDAGEVEKPNPHSAVVWKYTGHDFNGDGKFKFEETMHRATGNAAVKDGLVFIADFSGLMHCVDAKTGKPYWTHDMLSPVWGSALAVDGKVYVGDEDGIIRIFELSKVKKVLGEPSVQEAVYGTPIVANGVLFVGSNGHLFAIGK